ncbi:hypothetical protein TcasGA2_TC001531 [Tribolium castaneum]|uniref:Uncharacterized protein n=1 Tax=Tribolium castaneum TaxID=7070 RepID=D7EI47_TRICA|nr:hypothetical protein TcasGA2_TC001531 [Tribolium castaneum]
MARKIYGNCAMHPECGRGSNSGKVYRDYNPTKLETSPDSQYRPETFQTELNYNEVTSKSALKAAPTHASFSLLIFEIPEQKARSLLVFALNKITISNEFNFKSGLEKLSCADLGFERVETKVVFRRVYIRDPTCTPPKLVQCFKMSDNRNKFLGLYMKKTGPVKARQLFSKRLQTDLTMTKQTSSPEVTSKLIKRVKISGNTALIDDPTHTR